MAENEQAKTKFVGKNSLTELVTQIKSLLLLHYLKSETYSKTEIDTMVSAIPKFKIKVISELPTSNISESTIYLLSTGNETDNLYTEYIYANKGTDSSPDYVWEKLGTQKLDLSGYSTTAQMNTAIANALASYSTTSQVSTMISTALAAYYTKTEANNTFVPKTRKVNNKGLSSDLTLTPDDLDDTVVTVNNKFIKSINADTTITALSAGLYMKKANGDIALIGYNPADSKKQFKLLEGSILEIKNDPDTNIKYWTVIGCVGIQSSTNENAYSNTNCILAGHTTASTGAIDSNITISEIVTRGIATAIDGSNDKLVTNKIVFDEFSKKQDTINSENKISADFIKDGISNKTIPALTAGKALVSDENGKVTTSNATATEIGFLSGLSSNLQEQLNAMQESMEEISAEEVQALFN